MKPVYKCDYCSQMGTEEEIREHEIMCTENYDRKNCHTCKYKKLNVKTEQFSYECKAGKDIPEGKLYEFCDSYEIKEKTDSLVDMIFGDLFK